MSFLLDTKVVSKLRKRRPDPSVVAWFRRHRRDDLYLSVLTVGELRRGVERVRRRNPTSAGALDGWMKRILDEFSDRILPSTAASRNGGVGWALLTPFRR